MLTISVFQHISYRSRPLNCERSLYISTYMRRTRMIKGVSVALQTVNYTDF